MLQGQEWLKALNWVSSFMLAGPIVVAFSLKIKIKDIGGNGREGNCLTYSCMDLCPSPWAFSGRALYLDIFVEQLGYTHNSSLSPV